MANTIADKLTYLSGTKDAIKQAIIGKGVEVTDTDTFRSYANKIEAIQSGGGGTVNLPDGTKFGHSTFTTVPDSIIPYLETQTDLSSIFAQCKFLRTVQLFDTSQATDMTRMFNDCESLQIIPEFDTSSVINMSYTFAICSSLISIPQLNTSSVNDMSWMFASCQILETVPLLNVSNTTDISFIFFDCHSLTNLGGFTGLKLDLDLSFPSKLTVESVMNVITAAADMTSEPKTLTLHKDVFNKLSEEQIATASAKGWNIAVF